MLELELPFTPESVSRLTTSHEVEPEVLAFTRLGCWGLSHLSSTLAIDGRPRLVGRELESVRLLHAIDAVARENQAVVATIAGAPGSGKTRLIEDALTVAAAAGFEGRVFSVAACPDDAKNATLARLLSARFGLDSPTFKRERLLRGVGELLDDQRVEDVCYFLGDLVGARFEATPLARTLAQQPWQAEMALQTIVCELFAADSRRAPLCIVVEDLQHIDRDSLATLLALIDQLQPGTLLLCSGPTEFFKRHEYFASGGSASHEHVELAPLEASDVRGMLRQVVGRCANEARALEDYVVATALGNPGLVQELVRELWASGALQPIDDGCSFEPALVPELASTPRLRVASDVRRSSLPGLQLALLEAGAIVGSTCWVGLWPTLLRVASPELAGLDPGLLAQALGELEQDGHLLRLPDSSIEGETELLFRDPPERDRLAAQVSPSKARLLHRAVADWLSSRERSVSGDVELLQLMARHLAASGSSYRASSAFLKAAEQARAQGSTLEAAGNFERGLRELGDQDNRRRIDVLHDYGAVLAELGCPAQARQAFVEMAELASQLNLPGKHGAALNRLGRVYRDSGELQLARQAFERALSSFEEASDERGLAATRDDLGRVLWLLGERVEALQLLRAALRSRKQRGDERSLAVSLGNLALAWDEQGDARSSGALALVGELCERLADPRARCDALIVHGRVATRHRDLEQARAAFRDALQLAHALKDRPRFARAAVALGVTELRLGELARAEELLTRGGQLAYEIEAWLELSEARRALGKLALRRGQAIRARQDVCAALRLARRARCPGQVTAALRTLAEVVALTSRGSAEQRAVGYYMRSIELSKQFGDERELAKGYRALAHFADRYDNPEIRQQSQILLGLSAEIFGRYEARAA